MAHRHKSFSYTIFKSILAMILTACLLSAIALPIYATDAVATEGTESTMTQPTVPTETVATTQTVPTETATDNETTDKEDDNWEIAYDSIIWFALFIVFAALIYEQEKQKSRNAIEVLTNCISENDKITRGQLSNIKEHVDALVAVNPKLLKTPEYKRLMESLVAANTAQIADTKYKSEISKIYRVEFSVKETPAAPKTVKNYGYKFIPYVTEDEFKTLKAEHKGIKMEHEQSAYGGFAICDKEDKIVAHFECRRGKRPHFTNIAYAKDNSIDDKLFVRLLAAVTDYAHEFFGCAYLFVEIKKPSKKMLHTLKEYEFKKSNKKADTFYSDKNAELGLISTISVE